jgi:hypothetical protein
MNSPPTFFGPAGEPVPAVDAEDLQTAYEILTDPARRPAGGGTVGFSIHIFSRCCKAGADIPAVAYRAMMLQLLPMMAHEQIAPLMKDDGKFDALFTAMDCVLHNHKGIYCSSELTSGLSAYNAMSEHGVRSSKALKQKLGEDWFKANIEERNKAAAADFAKRIFLEKKGQIPVINPGPLTVPSWG